MAIVLTPSWCWLQTVCKTISHSRSMEIPSPFSIQTDGGYFSHRAMPCYAMPCHTMLCHSGPGKTVGSVSAGMSDFIPLEFWRAYWQGATVGTRPQREREGPRVIVILFFLLSWTDNLPFSSFAILDHLPVLLFRLSFFPSR